jgi:hypothetical protein
VHDNLGTIYRSFFEITSIDLVKNSTSTSLTINNRLPSNLTNATISLAALETFLEGTYANKTATTLNVDQTQLAAPFLFFEGPGLNYSWNSPERATTTLSGSSAVTSYLIKGTISDQCGQAQCSISAGGWNWITCGANDLFVRVEITDTAGTLVKVKNRQEGCLTLGSTNDFTLSGKNGGSVKITVGNYSGVWPGVRFEGAKPLFYNSNLTANLSTSTATLLWLPVLTTIDYSLLPNLVLIER